MCQKLSTKHIRAEIIYRPVATAADAEQEVGPGSETSEERSWGGKFGITTWWNKRTQTEIQTLKLDLFWGGQMEGGEGEWTQNANARTEIISKAPG